jgi:undecaprenyl diphosphate synthase
MSSTSENKKQSTNSDDIFIQNGIDPDKLPDHISIIMDGNGRWAKKRFLPRTMGHKEGAEALRRTIKACAKFKVSALSVYVFSTENWKRPQEEVSFLMGFFKRLLVKELAELHKEGVRVRCLGDIDSLNSELQELIKTIEQTTNDNKTLQLNLMINYGSRHEIINACQKILNDKKQIDVIDEDTFSKYLYTADIPDPDILIRTGGNLRISNFLLWQSAYTEMFFLDTLWPDFDENILLNVIKSFQKRTRRFGGL